MSPDTKSRVSSERERIHSISPGSRDKSRERDDPQRSKISKLSKERSSILQNSQIKRDSVIVSSPRIHDRKSSTKLRGLKDKKNKNDDTYDRKEYEDEVNDKVDANDIAFIGDRSSRLLQK